MVVSAAAPAMILMRRLLLRERPKRVSPIKTPRRKSVSAPIMARETGKCQSPGSGRARRSFLGVYGQKAFSSRVRTMKQGRPSAIVKIRLFEKVIDIRLS